MIAFLPSLVFFVIAPLSVSLALWLAFAAAFAVGIRAFGARRTIRLFDAVGLILFGALALYTAVINPEFGPGHTALTLQTGLLLAILWSMAAGRPFTAQYHWLNRPQQPQSAADAHRMLTAGWATAYAAMAAANAAAIVLHKMSPVWAGICGLLIFASMLTFTWQFGLYIDRYGVPFCGRR